MRILGFVTRWKKLDKPFFTTFRYPRKDKDWLVGEKVQIVINPRSKKKLWLGVAKILSIEKRNIGFKEMEGMKSLTDAEAKNDGFRSKEYMITWMFNLYGERIVNEPMNKLLFKWVERKPEEDILTEI